MAGHSQDFQDKNKGVGGCKVVIIIEEQEGTTRRAPTKEKKTYLRMNVSKQISGSEYMNQSIIFMIIGFCKSMGSEVVIL